MSHKTCLRRLMLSMLTGAALTVAGITAPFIPGVVPIASAQVSADFQEALAPYGQWIRHPRWGMIWVPGDIPRDWRPYQYGHWVYTEEWGWYWVSDPEEEDWGWVAFHYGRWANDRRLGWFWIPGDEWAPAWVDWRYGGDYVGWAPLPPDELLVVYDDNPSYWVFVSPRFLTAPRLRTYYLSPSRRANAFRNSRVVNRSVAFGRGRAAVNPGLSPAFIARASGAALPTYRVTPRVLSRTQGVANAVRVSPDQLQAAPGGAQRGRRPNANRANAVTVQPTTTTIAPNAAAAPPAALGKGERGRLGSQPPRAAQGGAPAAQPTPAPQPAQQQQAPQRPASPAQQPSQPPAVQRQAPQRPASPTPPPNQPPAAQQPAIQAAPPAAAPSQAPPSVDQQRRIELRERRPPGGAAPPSPVQVRPAAPAAPQPPAPAQAKPTPPAAPPQRQPPNAASPPPHRPPPAAARPQPPAAPKPPPPAAAKPPPPPAAAKPPPPAAAQKKPPAQAKPAPKPEEPPK